MKKAKDTTLKTLHNICAWLIIKTSEANAETMRITHHGVRHKGKNLGDWEITVKKSKRSESDNTIKRADITKVTL